MVLAAAIAAREQLLAVALRLAQVLPFFHGLGVFLVTRVTVIALRLPLLGVGLDFLTPDGDASPDGIRRLACAHYGVLSLSRLRQRLERVAKCQLEVFVDVRRFHLPRDGDLDLVLGTPPFAPTRWASGPALQGCPYDQQDVRRQGLLLVKEHVYLVIFELCRRPQFRLRPRGRPDRLPRPLPPLVHARIPNLVLA